MTQSRNSFARLSRRMLAAAFLIAAINAPQAQALETKPPAPAKKILVETASNTGSWVNSFGGAGNDGGSAVAVDGSGNIYLAGYFSGTADLGGGSPVTSAGGVGLVLAKYNNAGVQQWSYGFSGPSGGITPKGIGVDASGNIYVAGYYTGSANFGGTTFASAGQQDAFVAKYSPQGQHLWSESFGGTGADVFNGLDLDSQGNVVVTGSFQSSVSFGGANLYNVPNGAGNIVLAKYSPTGAHLWSETFANASSPDYAYGVAVDKRINPTTGLAYDNIVVTGSFYNWVDFGGGQLTSSSTSFVDLFVAKFTTSGSYIWAKRYGGIYGENGCSLALDGNGDVVVVGSFWNQTDLGGGIVIGTACDQDMFVAKYSGVDGSYIWAKPLIGNDGGWAQSVKCDGHNNIVLAGYYYGTFDFGRQFLTSNGGSYDIFAAKYASSGALTWVSSYGGGGTTADEGAAVAIDGANHAIVTGFFGDTASFGGTTLTSAGSYDAVLMRLGCSGTFTINDFSCDQCVTRDVAFWSSHVVTPPRSTDSCVILSNVFNLMPGGVMNLGFVQVNLAGALGLFWGNPIGIGGQGSADDVCIARKALAKELIAAIANVTLLNPDSSGCGVQDPQSGGFILIGTLIAEAQAATQAEPNNLDCSTPSTQAAWVAEMNTLTALLNMFNGGGVSMPFPGSLTDCGIGAANASYIMDHQADPTTQSNCTCMPTP